MDKAEMGARIQHAIKRMTSLIFPGSRLTLSQMQDLSTRDVPEKGPLWVSKSTIPVFSDHDLREIVLQAIDDFGDGSVRSCMSSTDSLTLEWNGYRRLSNASTNPVSEQEKYECLMRDTSSEMTILYAHGGGYVFVPNLQSCSIQQRK